MNEDKPCKCRAMKGTLTFTCPELNKPSAMCPRHTRSRVGLMIYLKNVKAMADMIRHNDRTLRRRDLL